MKKKVKVEVEMKVKVKVEMKVKVKVKVTQAELSIDLIVSFYKKKRNSFFVFYFCNFLNKKFQTGF